MTHRILVIEDDDDIALGVAVVLGKSGFEVTIAADGRAGLRVFHRARPDLLVLDIELPGLDGWTVLERVRDLSDVPVLILTAHGKETEKVRALDGGADDYLTKPFGNAELTARVRALLRRRPPGDDKDEIFDDGRVRLDFTLKEVRVQGVPVALTPTEYRLLVSLVRHRGQILTPGKLLELAWSDPFAVGPERVKYSVLRLRRKLGDASGGASRIESVRGFGYRYRDRPPRDGPALVSLAPKVTAERFRPRFCLQHHGRDLMPGCPLGELGLVGNGPRPRPGCRRGEGRCRQEHDDEDGQHSGLHQVRRAAQRIAVGPPASHEPSQPGNPWCPRPAAHSSRLFRRPGVLALFLRSRPAAGAGRG